MQGLEKLLEPHLWNPFSWLGIDNYLLKVNADTIINTWFILALMTISLLILRYFITKKDSIIGFSIVTVVKSFVDLTTQTFGTFIYPYFSLITSLFIFILMCNWISIIPWTHEPTTDLNTTLALGIVTFLYKETQTIKVHGFKGYIKEFLEPFFIMFPLNVIGHLSKVISISFRLFGNIFGGAIIGLLWNQAIAGSIITETVGIISGLNFIILGFFVLFEGFIQAFVFTMLTLTYLSIAVQHEE